MRDRGQRDVPVFIATFLRDIVEYRSTPQLRSGQTFRPARKRIHILARHFIRLVLPAGRIRLQLRLTPLMRFNLLDASNLLLSSARQVWLDQQGRFLSFS